MIVLNHQILSRIFQTQSPIQNNRVKQKKKIGKEKYNPEIRHEEKPPFGKVQEFVNLSISQQITPPFWKTNA
jgi:stalled ribosome alternative rescue factor ArfA